MLKVSGAPINKGVVLIEFIIVIPLFLLFIFAIFELGRLLIHVNWGQRSSYHAVLHGAVTMEWWRDFEMNRIVQRDEAIHVNTREVRQIPYISVPPVFEPNGTLLSANVGGAMPTTWRSYLSPFGSLLSINNSVTGHLLMLNSTELMGFGLPDNPRDRSGDVQTYNCCGQNSGGAYPSDCVNPACMSLSRECRHFPYGTGGDPGGCRPQMGPFR